MVSTVGVGVVSAADVNSDYETQSTNLSDYSVNFVIDNKQDVTASSYVEVKGLKTSKIENNYYVKFVEKNATKPDEIKKNSISSQMKYSVDGYLSLSATTDGRYMTSIPDEAYLYNRDYYAYIYNCTKNVDYTTYCKVTTDQPIKVEKEAIPNLTERYKIFFFGNDAGAGNIHYLSVFPLYPSIYSKDVSIVSTLKVGIIEDESVIRAMARNESGAKEKLYNYAKNANNGLTYTGELTNFHDVDTSNLTVQDGKYYYMYMDIEDPTNKYIDVSDAIIVMGEYGMLVNNVKYGDYEDISYKDYEYACYSCNNDYVWEAKGYQANTCTLVDSITSKASCVKNAKTGVEDHLVPGTIILIVGGAIVALLSKKSHFKKI